MPNVTKFPAIIAELARKFPDTLRYVAIEGGGATVPFIALHVGKLNFGFNCDHAAVDYWYGTEFFEGEDGRRVETAIRCDEEGSPTIADGLFAALMAYLDKNYPSSDQSVEVKSTT